MQPSAKIILDSISPNGVRLTTMEVVMHRFVLAEFNTHRMFSRNSASSRAIPVEKILKRVSENPALPVYFGLEKPGMQAGEEMSEQDIERCKDTIRDMSKDAILDASYLNQTMFLHKQNANRYLEPWMWHTVIVTATEWNNFFWQRCSPLAQPEMKAAADEMQRAYFRSEPKLLNSGEWHLPYASDKETEEEILSLDFLNQEYNEDSKESLRYAVAKRKENVVELKKKVSTARCARVSVLQHDGTRAIEKDLEMFDRLRNAMPIHISPFEHVATPLNPLGYSKLGVDITKEFSGNFRGWKQFRKEIPNENLTKFIPNLPDLADIAEKMRSE